MGKQIGELNHIHSLSPFLFLFNFFFFFLFDSLSLSVRGFKMIRAKTLPKLLAQALSGGVSAALLFDAQGSMLAFAGEDINSNQMVSAIVANLWTSFESKESGLECLLFDFEKGRVVACRTSQFVLCLYGGLDCPFGMLKSKAMALAEYLQVRA